MNTISFAPETTKSLAQYVLQQLRQVDPHFPEEERRYQAAVAARQGAGTQLRECICAREEMVEAAILYMMWKGFSLGMEIFCDPDKAAGLDGDLEMLYQEETLLAIPMIRQTQQQLCGAYRALSSQSETAMVEPLHALFDYHAYLETVGYKIAHYLGFRTAEVLLPQSAARAYYGQRYRLILEDYLQIDLGNLNFGVIVP